MSKGLWRANVFFGVFMLTISIIGIFTGDGWKQRAFSTLSSILWVLELMDLPLPDEETTLETAQ